MMFSSNTTHLGGSEYWATYTTNNATFSTYSSLLQISGVVYPQAYTSATTSFVGYSINAAGVLQSGWSTPNNSFSDYPERVCIPNYDTTTQGAYWASASSANLSKGYWLTGTGKSYSYISVLANGTDTGYTTAVYACPYGSQGAVVNYYYNDGASTYRGHIFCASGNSFDWRKYITQAYYAFSSVIQPNGYGAVIATVMNNASTHYVMRLSVSTGALFSLRKITVTSPYTIDYITNIASDTAGTYLYYIGYGKNSSGNRRSIVRKADMTTEATSWAVLLDSASLGQIDIWQVAFYRGTNTTYFVKGDSSGIYVSGIDDSGACVGLLRIVITGAGVSNYTNVKIVATADGVYVSCSTFYATDKRLWLFKLPLDLNITASNSQFAITKESTPSVVSLTTTVAASTDLTLTNDTTTALSLENLTSSNRTVTVTKVDY